MKGKPFNSLIVGLIVFLLALGGGLQEAVASNGKHRITLVRVEGSVLVKLTPKAGWTPGKKWMQIPLEAKVKTLKGSMVELMIDQQVMVRMKENGLLEVGHMVKAVLDAFKKAQGKSRGLQGKGTLIHLRRGKAYFYVSPGYPGLPLIVDTPIGIAGVSGTKFVVDFSSGSQVVVGVFQGQVIVWPAGRPQAHVLVGPGYITVMRPEVVPSPPVRMTEEQIKVYQEGTRLHLGLNLDELPAEAGARYSGSFTRGYSPRASTVAGQPMSSNVPRTFRDMKGMASSQTGYEARGKAGEHAGHMGEGSGMGPTVPGSGGSAGGSSSTGTGTISPPTVPTSHTTPTPSTTSGGGAGGQTHGRTPRH